MVSLSLEAGTFDDYLFCLFRKFQKYIILLEGFSPLLILLLASQTEKPQEKYYNRSYVLLFCFSLIFKPASLSSFLNPQLVSTTTWTEVVALFFQTWRFHFWSMCVCVNRYPMCTVVSWPTWCWGLNSGSLREQEVLLTPTISSPPLPRCWEWNSGPGTWGQWSITMQQLSPAPWRQGLRLAGLAWPLL